MEFVIEKNDDCTETIAAVNPIMKRFLEGILNEMGQNLTSLDYFVVADSEDTRYAKTVMKYADILGTEAHITQDGRYFAAGKVLEGIDLVGNLHQAIVVKSSIWVNAALDYLNAQKLLSEQAQQKMSMPPYMSLALILHEVGHVIDNENRHNIFGAINTKIKYNLSCEYDEYIKNTALSLWGEYYAESFVYQIIRTEDDFTQGRESELIACLSSYSMGTDMNSLLERVYRILYFFVIRIAFIHRQSNYERSFDYKRYENSAKVSDYIPILMRVESAIKNLYKDYPKWNTYTQLDELKGVFEEFVHFEYKKQMENEKL